MALTPIGFIRKLGKLVRGGATPLQLFLGCLLGVLIGMVPGFNLTLVVLILLVLILNANGGLAGLGFALGKVLCLALAPVTFRIGYGAIHDVGLSGLFRAAADTPVVALMDLHYYCLTGGLLLGLLVGAAFGIAMTYVIKGIRKGLAAAGDRSERAKRVTSNFAVRFILRLVFGKQKESLSEILAKKAPVLRKSGIILCAVVVILVVVLQMVLVDVFFADALRSQMEAAVGAEVNLEAADLSLFGGRLAIEGLQVTDPEKPTHNLVQVQKLTGDVSLAGLLTKRLIVDELTVVDVQTDAKRKSPGRVLEEAPTPEPKLPEDALSEYFEKGKQLQQYLQKLQEYLEKSERTVEQPTEEDLEDERQRLRELAEAQGYWALSAQRILSRHPTWVIRKLEVRPLRVKQVAGELAVSGEQLSNAPQLHPEPLALRVAEGKKTLVSLRLDHAKPGGEHHLTLHTPPLALGEAFKLSDRAPIDVADGTAQVDVEDGVFTDASFSRFPFVVTVRDLKAGSREGRGMLGLDPKTSQEAMKHLTQIKLAGRLDGRLNAPRLRLDEKAILSAVKDTLVQAGKAELARRADQQLKKLGSQLTGKAGGEVGEAVKKTTGGLLEGVLPGVGKKKPEASTTQPKKEGGKKGPGGILDSLLK